MWCAAFVRVAAIGDQTARPKSKDKELHKLIRVLLADYHQLVRQGVAALLDKEYDIEVIGEASNGQEAIELIDDARPDVLVMDLSMPRLDGEQAAERILNSKNPPAIVILSVHTNSVLAHNLIKNGVKGYLLKMASAEELPLAIRSAAQGKTYVSPAIAASVIDVAGNRGNEAGVGTKAMLSAREREVLQLISEGNTNSFIAEGLSISIKTVEKHRANLMSKLGVHDLPALIKRAIKEELILDES